MKTKTTSYSHLADLCERKGHTLELAVHKRGMTLRILRQGESTLHTELILSNPDAAAKRLLEKL